MHDGLLVRGEWIRGHPFDGAWMRGWYVDALVHRPGLGAVTPVVRYETYDYEGSRGRVTWIRLTTGARVRLSSSLTAQVNVVHQNCETPGTRTALDVGLTHSLRF
jgi:hypothetical protein